MNVWRSTTIAITCVAAAVTSGSHIWTNTANYLVSVHVQAPTGVDALDAAGARLTGDIKVEIP